MASKEYKLAVRIMGIMDGSLSKSAALTKKQIRDIAKQAAAPGIPNAVQQLANNEKILNAPYNAMKKIGKAGAVAMGTISAAALMAGKKAVDVGMDFDKAMSSWKGTAKASEAEFNLAREAAMKYGRETTKTATESANALEYMALAGWSVGDSVKALPSVLKLSEATNLDLARTSDLVTDSMSATGEVIGENGTNLQRFLDVATMANNKSNQTAEQLMEAWIQTGGVFKGLKVDIEDSATALGVLANRGIKGSEAGTALNAIMINLTTGAGQAGKAMQKLGVSAFENGKFKGLKQTLTEVRDKLSGLTEEEQNYYKARIGGKHHIDAFTHLLNGLDAVKDGKNEWDGLNESLRNANGSLQQMAATKMDNLWGDTKILQSAMQDLGIKASDAINIPLRDGAKAFTNMVYASDGFIGNLEELYPKLKRGAEGFGEFVEPVLKIGEFFVSNPEWLTGAVTGFASMAVFMKASNAVPKGIESIVGLVTALGANPALAWATGLSLLAGGIIGVARAVDAYNAKEGKKDLNKRFGDMKLSLKELGDVAMEIVGKKTFERLSQASKQLSAVGQYSKEIDRTAESLQKLQLRLSVNSDFNKEDAEKLGTELENLASGVSNLVSEQQIAMHFSIRGLFGEGDATGEGLIKQFDGMYTSIRGDVERIGKQLGDEYKKAMEDGIITPIEQETINTLTQQLLDLKEQAMQSENNAKWSLLNNDAENAPLTSESFANVVNKSGEYAKEMADNADELAKNALMNAESALKKSKELGLSEGQDGYYSQSMYNSAIADIEKRRQGVVMEAKAKPIELLTNKILSAYGKEFNERDNRIRNLEPGAVLRYDEEDLVRFENKKAQRGLEDYLKEYAEPIKQFREEVASMETIPEDVQKTLDKLDKIESVTGDKKQRKKFLQNFFGSESELTESAKYYASVYGYSLKKEFSKPISVNTNIQLQNGSMSGMESIINSVRNFFSGQNVKVNMPIAPFANPAAKVESTAKAKGLDKPSLIRKFAIGGRVNGPTNALIGEGGDAEYVIPMNNSARAASLLQQANAELSGINPSVGGQHNISYSPTINISGGNANEIKSVLSDSYADFKAMMDRYARETRRTSF
jgi:phage tail tape measure protein, TP901 family|nr:MAG TPA: minor tail protein [Caudoviricetes sp.]